MTASEAAPHSAELESPLKADSSTNKFVLFLFNYKRVVFSLSVVLIAVSLYIGKDAFAEDAFKDGGFTPPSTTPPRKESSEVGRRMTRKLGGAPEYAITLMVRADNGTVDEKFNFNYTSPAFKTYYNIIRDDLKSLPVVGVISYYDYNTLYPNDRRLVSGDGKKVLMHATIDGDIADKKDGINTKIRETVEKSIKKYKLPVRVYVGGLVPFREEMGKRILAGVEMAETGSLPVAFVLLYLALGSLMLSFTAWYVAVGSIFATLSVLVGLSRHFSISGLAANIVTLVFSLGLGINYALIIVSRFAQERTKYPRVHSTRIAKQTLLTSGRTVAFSAVTVFLALSGGLLFQEFFLASQCLAVMITASLAALMANTFMLSLLMWMDGGCTSACGSTLFSGGGGGGGGNALFWCPAPNLFAIIARKFKFSFARGLVADPSLPKVRDEVSPEGGATEADPPSSVAKCGDNEDGAEPLPSPSIASAIHEEEPSGVFFNIGVFVIKRPIFVLLACTSFLVAWTAYFFIVTQYGVTDATTLQGSSHNRQIYERLHDGTFPTLGKSRVYVYLESKTAFPITSDSFLIALDAFQSKLLEVRGVVDVKSMVNTGQSSMTLSLYKAQYAAPYVMPYLPYTAPLLFPYKLTDLKFSTYLDVSLDYHQYGPDAATALKAIRSLLKSPTIFFDVDGTSMLAYSGVGGTPALRNDSYEDIMEIVPAWLGILFASTFLLLLVMTKSIVVPLKAITMIVISLGGTLGILMAIFPFGTPEVQKALGFGSSGYVDGSNVIFVFSIGYSLSVDYELFLISRIREEWIKCKNTERAILVALTRAGSLITSAAVILGTTTFAFIANEVQFMKFIGIGIAISVVVDATVVRMLLVPAVLVLLGDYAWYCPEWLGRAIDHLGLSDDRVVLDDFSLSPACVDEDAKEKIRGEEA